MRWFLAFLVICLFLLPAEANQSEISELSRLLWGEARGLNAPEQRLVVWTALNRLRDGRFGNTLFKIVTDRKQFHGYNPKHPVRDDMRKIVNDCLAAWHRGEKAPILPPYANHSNYLYFRSKRGKDGKMHNYFR